MEIGFVGLGNMGKPMVANILSAGHTVTVYNRTREKAKTFTGVKIASSPAEAAHGDAIITMLADDGAVEHLVMAPGGLINGLRSGATHISMSTISVALAERLAQAHAERGQSFISAPVFGRPEAAQAKKLFVVAAGPEHTVRKMQPLFDAVGQKTFYVGDRAAMANAVKLSGNFLIAAMIETLGEAFSLVRKYGISPEIFLDILTNSLFNAPIYRTYGGIIAEGKYEPVGFRLALGLKDVRLALEAAENAAVPMPVAGILRDRFLTGMAHGMADADWASIARLVAESAGLKT